MACDNLCTAAKCQELENRIGALEQALELLEASFEAHTNQDIPQAHNYTPTVDVELRIDNNTISSTVTVDNVSSFDQTELPEPPSPTVDVELRIDNNTISSTVTVDNVSGFDQTELPKPEPSEPEPPTVNLDLQIDNNTISGIVTVDGVSSFDQTELPIFQGEQGERGPQGEPGIQGERGLRGFQGESGEDVNCDEFGNALADCCAQILAAINEVRNYVTIDVSGQANSEYECVEPTEENDNKTEKLTPTNYQGVGLVGLHENLKLINANLDSIFTATCGIESSDVVAIVASDKVLDRYEGKTLVLHLVTFDNYPKRGRNSTYWQQQIPNARAAYDWNADFKNLIQERGNLYAELYFENIKDPVSGWFASKASADSWFTSILALTTATERNRKYHEQLTPKRSIIANTVRPYRAFITSVNDAGQGICEVKYVPPVENE